MNYIMRKLKIKHLYIVGLLCVACNLITSCSDDELFSVDQRVYVNSGINGIVSLHLVDTPIGVITEQRTLGFPVVSSRELAADAEITFKVDESLVESYNTANNSEYKVLPASCYSIKNLVVRMKQGEFTSQDSVKIEIAKPEEVDLEEVYLLPLTISNLTTDDKGAQVSANLNTIYLKIDKEYKIYDESPISDDRLISKTGWTIFSNNGTSEGNMQNLIDGDVATPWLAYYSPIVVTIDTKVIQDIIGFAFCPYYGIYGTYYSAQTISVSASDDDNDYTDLVIDANVKADGNSQNPVYNYIKLYSSVKARYLRITFANPNSFVGLNEINLYK